MKIIKPLQLALIAGLCLVAARSHATLYNQTFSVSAGAIPDGNPTGVVFTGNFTAAPVGAAIDSIAISLNISGGYNGNLYAYLVAPNGTRITLMNEPGMAVNGFGATGAGMNINLQDGAANGSIQNVTTGGFLTGTYSAASTLGTFNNSTADGNWTLFFEDTTSGGGTSTLNSWSLNITAVPEPITWALIIFGVAFSLAELTRRWVRSEKPGCGQR